MIRYPYCYTRLATVEVLRKTHGSLGWLFAHMSEFRVGTTTSPVIDKILVDRIAVVVYSFCKYH